MLDNCDVRFKYGQKTVIVIFLICLSLFSWFNVNEILYQLMIGDIFWCLFACAMYMTNLTVFGSYVSLIHQMKNVRNIFNGIQQIFDRCM